MDILIPHFNSLLLYIIVSYLNLPQIKKVEYAVGWRTIDHWELIDTLDKHPGPVLLFGYAASYTSERLTHWDRYTTRPLPRVAGEGKKYYGLIW